MWAAIRATIRAQPGELTDSAIPGTAAAAVAAVTPEMIAVRPGAFLMGSPPSEPQRRDDEAPRVVVITRPFVLGRTEITQGLWRSVMGGNPSYFDGCERCPVESVSWYDAIRFCNELSRREGLAPAYALRDSLVDWDPAAPGFRLPTEAEWEYACRAGVTSPYATGECLTDAQANFNAGFPAAGCPDGLNRGEPAPVGSFAPNAWGFHDMHGNVAEWCWDRYAPYPAGQATDPAGPPAGPLRVVRGGNFANHGPQLRSACRRAMRPERGFDLIGLRVARTVTP